MSAARLETHAGWVDLAAACLGGRALLASDEFFAPKENLLVRGRAVFCAERYTDRGKWMDGWETRRRRTSGHDWCIVRLGLAGRVRAITVDTGHFRGNHPESASLEGFDAGLAGIDNAGASDSLQQADWRPLAVRTALLGDHENRLEVLDVGRLTHVRLHIFPDGGVARLRVFGSVEPAWPRILAGASAIDLAALAHGGRVLDCSDAFFSRPIHLLLPGDGASMADGWETRRRRGPGHDWALLRLGRRGRLQRAMIDTRHFKGNFPARCSLEGADLPGLADDAAAFGDAPWQTLLTPSALGPDAEHAFMLEDVGAVTHVRLNIFPDGGVSRLRLFGRPEARTEEAG